MHYSLFSDNKRFVNVIMLLGAIMLVTGVGMQITGIVARYSLWLLGLGLILQFWSAFSYIFVKTKTSDSNPSKVIANISFLVLTGFWTLLFFWIFVNTQYDYYH